MQNRGMTLKIYHISRQQFSPQYNPIYPEGFEFDNDDFLWRENNLTTLAKSEKGKNQQQSQSLLHDESGIRTQNTWHVGGECSYLGINSA